MAKGYIYIMTNPGLKDMMVKIGYATDVELRRKQLSTTALPYEYEIYATYETPGNLEDKRLHDLIDSLNPDLRVRKNREFYIMSPEDAFKLLEAIAIISGTTERLKKIKDEYSEADRKIKKPAINFTECGIPVGARLVFTEDESIVAIVVSDHKVQYNDELTSISAIARGIKGYSVSGSMYFTYNGKLLSDIANETQWKDCK